VLLGRCCSQHLPCSWQFTSSISKLKNQGGAFPTDTCLASDVSYVGWAGTHDFWSTQLSITRAPSRVHIKRRVRDKSECRKTC
jgi:hypothetical protein